jgi:hypothetical protein
MKVFKLVIFTVLLGISFVPITAKAIDDNSFSVGVFENEGDWGLQDQSKLELWEEDEALRPFFVQSCDEKELQKCLKNRTGNIYGYHFFPVCSRSYNAWCISNFSYTEKDQTNSKLIFISYLNDSRIEGDPKLNIIAGTSPSIWKSEEDGNYYLLKIFVTSGMDLRQSKRVLKPYQILTSISSIKNINDVQQKSMDGSHYLLECPQNKSQKCVAIQNISDKRRFNLRFVIPEIDAAWVFGRLDLPLVSKKSIGVNRNEISITAGTLFVPEYKSKITRESILKAMETYNPVQNGIISGLTLSNQLLAAQHADFHTLDFWLENTENRSTGAANYWNFRTISLRDEGGGYWDSCNSISSFSGLLTTNATVYDGFTPEYTNSYLEYQIGAPHYLSDGSVFEGKYYLNLRADLAKCLYGIKNKSARASIRITYSDKLPKIETESLKNSNGWYNLKVDGINFSSPKIKIKLS